MMCGTHNRTTAAADQAGSVQGSTPAHRTLFVLHNVPAAGRPHLMLYTATEQQQGKVCTSLKGAGREKWRCPVVGFLYAEDISLAIVYGFRKQGGWALASAPQPRDVCFVVSECTQPGALCPNAPISQGQHLEQSRRGERTEDTRAALDGVVQGIAHLGLDLSEQKVLTVWRRRAESAKDREPRARIRSCRPGLCPWGDWLADHRDVQSLLLYSSGPECRG